MSTPSKDKGDRAERALVTHLQAHGHPKARRTKAGGEKDLGDIGGVQDRAGNQWCIQVADRKWRSHGDIIAKVATVPAQCDTLGADYWCLITKRPGCPDAGDWFVWLPTWMLLDATAQCNNSVRIDVEPSDLACVTVRAWLELTAPEAHPDPELWPDLYAEEAA